MGVTFGSDFTSSGIACSAPNIFSKEDALDRIAHRVVELRLQPVVLFFLEAHLPFITVFQTAGLFLQPMLGPFLRREQLEVLRSIFSDRQTVEELIKRIDEQSKRS